MNQTTWIWILLIAFFGTLLYIQTIGFDYTLDDGIYANSNRVTLKGLEEWPELFKYGSMNFIEISPVNTGIYRPLTLLTFAVENELVGKFDPGVSHSINLLLYFALLVVLGFLLAELIQVKKLPWWVPALILLLYAVHPLHVEVVASAKSRDTLLSSLFAFSAILIWWRTQPMPKMWQWAVILGIYFLSLLSKEESIPLIALVGLIAYFFQRKSALQAMRAALPFAGAAAVYLLIRGLVLDTAATTYDSYINSILYVADGFQRLATNFYIYLEYVKLLFFPHPLSWDYSFSQLSVQSFSSPWVWVSVVLFGALIWLAYRGFKGRSLISFGLIFYFAAFSIFANLLPSLTIGSNLGERFLFVPSLAFAFLAVYGLFLLGKKWMPNRLHLIPLLVLVPVVFGFSWKTFDRAKVWKDNLSITRNDVESAPKSWRTHTFYAEELRRVGLAALKDHPDSAKATLQEAKKEYEIMFGILGKDLPVSQYLATYAEVLINLGDSAMAVTVLEENIERNPKAFYPLFQLGRFAYEGGEYEKAIDYYQKALQAQNPNFGPLYRNLGLSYSRNSEKDKAIVALEKSLEYFDGPEIRRALGFLYSELGQTEKAARYLATDENASAEEIAFINATMLGNIAFGKGDFQTSLSEYKKIEPIYEEVDGKTKFPTFYSALAKSLLETGDTLSSKTFFLRAVDEMGSKDPVVFTNLGTIAFHKDQNYPQAERYFQQAIDYGSTTYESYMNLASALLIQRKERQAIPVLEKAVAIQASRAAVGNLYLVHKSLGNTEEMNRYHQLLFPAGVPQ
ncbi:tetratricopeptide repeat protein [Algoriphagus terrigena]|uniref:tetratricopeptide repeat protein n=1 Tax=Algoriphagus terrigena TaxID=344884 RepID=UPI000421C3ED|nr:tetratricopeptide repeat protein [Algoriphagus terrigena]